MTEAMIEATIALAVGKDKAGATEIAKACRQAAVLYVGRMRGVDFNRELLTLNTIAGQTSYVVGKDFATNQPVLRNIQDIWRTDRTSAPIRLVPLDEFSAHARGSATVGAPQLATIHSNPKVLELFPTPSGVYTLKLYCKKRITALEQIPEDYHDVVLHVGITIAASLASPQFSLQMVKEGLADIQADTMLGWDGSRVDVDRILDQSTNARYSDSQNLLGG